MNRSTVLAALAAMLSTCNAALPDVAAIPAGDRPKNDFAKRAELIAPVAEGVLRCRPTFNACGVYYGAAAAIEGLKLEYRRKGAEEWRAVGDFPYFEETRDYRGSILRLEEDTVYEVRLGDRAHGEFRTWTSNPPIAKTVMLDPNGVSYPLVISAKGRPDGWIRYTARPGAVFKNSGRTPSLVVDGAEYVLFENLTLRGGEAPCVIELKNSRAVRVVNCDIAEWGFAAKTKFDCLGRPCVAAKAGALAEKYVKGRWQPRCEGMINFHGAVDIGRGCSETVLERCWIHDPVTHANSWFYSHPAGGEAVMLRRPDHSTVIRYCDFTGSDEHRFNDAVESEGNFHEDGGYNRDGDCYGNFMIFCNDDNIELDGGQQNVRCFDNRFESALCGVSIQGCMASPVYVFDNAFFGMCEEFDGAGQTLKTGGGQHGWEAYAFIDRNLFWGRGSGIMQMQLLRSKVRGNVFCGRQGLVGKQGDAAPYAESEGNRFNAELAEAELPCGLPVRDAGFTLDRARFSGIKLTGGGLAPETLMVTAKSTSKDPVEFKIAINHDMPWLRVTPAAGVIPAGGEVKLTVGFAPELMKTRRWYRGMFLVRNAVGMSRPVSVYVDTDYVNPFKCEKPGETAVYADFGPRRQLAQGEGYACEFTAPKDGRYYFLARLARSGERKSAMLRCRLGEEEAGEAKLQNIWPEMTWLMIGPNLRFGNTIAYRDLKAGEKIAVSFKNLTRPECRVECEGVVMTDSPGSFEPR